MIEILLLEHSIGNCFSSTHHSPPSRFQTLTILSIYLMILSRTYQIERIGTSMTPIAIASCACVSTYFHRLVLKNTFRFIGFLISALFPVKLESDNFIEGLLALWLVHHFTVRNFIWNWEFLNFGVLKITWISAWKLSKIELKKRWFDAIKKNWKKIKILSTILVLLSRKGDIKLDFSKYDFYTTSIFFQTIQILTVWSVQNDRF